MYERGKEHQKVGRDKAEDSHQWKHWVLDHPEMEGDPQFRLKIVSSFSDPLTRQLAEAVRIEQRGAEILNSKSEFSRCRIPRLRLDMDEWQTKKKNISTLQEEEACIKEPTGRQDDDKDLIEDLGMLETEAGRMDKKRKGDTPARKSKRRKLEKLEGCGEMASTDAQLGIEAMGIKVTTTTPGGGHEVLEISRLEQDTNRMIEKALEVVVRQERRSSRKEEIYLQ